MFLAQSGVVFCFLAARSSAFILNDEVAKSIRRTNRSILPPSTIRPTLSSTSIESSCDVWGYGEVTGHQNGVKVGIAGAGAVAMGTAAILSKNGHDVMLWSPSGKSTSDFDEGTSEEAGRNYQKPIISTGSMAHQFVTRIAANSQQLVNDNSVVIIALPANGHKQVLDEIAPHLRTTASSSSGPPQHKHVIISSHASLGALYLSKLLLNDGEQDHHQPMSHKSAKSSMTRVTITAWGTTICTARRPSVHHVDIKSIRQSVDLCSVPREEISSGLRLCQRLFPDTEFRSRDGVLAISLSNVNPQNHLGMALGNMSRMERGEDWYQFQNTTPKIGALLEALDRERLDIAEALDVDVKTIYEHFSLSFHVPITGSIADMCQQIYANGNDVYGPNTAESRYITEDVPFGLALTVALGRLVNKPAVLHESGIAICSAMYGEDFAAENDLLKALDLSQISLEDLKVASYTGRLPPGEGRDRVLRSQASQAVPVHS